MLYDYLWETKTHLCLREGRLFDQMMGECFIRCGEHRNLKGSRDTSYVQHCTLY